MRIASYKYPYSEGVTCQLLKTTYGTFVPIVQTNRLQPCQVIGFWATCPLVRRIARKKIIPNLMHNPGK